MKAFQGAKAKIVRRFGVNIFETDKLTYSWSSQISNEKRTHF